MALDKQILSLAIKETENERVQNERLFEERRNEVFDAAPEIFELSRILSTTASKLMYLALNSDSDPTQYIDKLKQENFQIQEKRAALLVKNGFPKDYLERKYSCSICKDQGYVGTEMCSCLKKRYATLLKKKLSSVLPINDENFESFNFNYYSSKPDERMRISPAQNIEINFDICSEYARSFGNHCENLLLFGSSGLGKTFLSSCIAKTVTEKGFSVCYDTAISILQHYENEKFSNQSTVSKAAIERYLYCDLLIIDDLGTELTTAYTVSALYSLINNRLMASKPTIINTNLIPSDIAKRYSPAIASRINGEFKHLRFLGEDIRQIKKKEK